MHHIRALTTLLLLITTASILAADRSNILLIVVDDQSPQDLKAYNAASVLNSPTIDQLAARGVVVENVVHMGSFSGAVCTPSRHMMMCGRSVWHLPISPGAKAGNRCPPNLELSTLPAVFNRAGYDTMRTCKRGNSYEAANKQFTVRRDDTKRGDTDDTGSAWHAEQVLDYLRERQAARDDDPFLIWFGFSHPHDTRDGKPEYLAKYGATNHTDRANPPALNPLAPPLPVNYLPRHPFPDGHPNLRDEVDVSGVWTRRDEATIRNEIGRQFACSEYIDAQIDRVLDQLESTGDLANTIVIYTSDHGMAIGRHGLQGKQNLYQHTWQVPFIAAGPGIPAGTRAAGDFYLLDLLATCCDFAGITPPESNEGLSARPVLTGQAKSLRDVLFGVYSGGTKPGMRCVRKDDWKLIKYDVLDGAVRQTQLFNLKDNPHELLSEHHAAEVAAVTHSTPTIMQRNLADDPDYAAVRTELEALLLEEMTRLHDPERLWDQR